MCRPRSRPRLPPGLSVQRPAQRGQQVEQMLAAFHLNLTALSYVALLVGLFLVYNTVSVAVLSRRSEIGTLRALGVTRARRARAVPGRSGGALDDWCGASASLSDACLPTVPWPSQRPRCQPSTSRPPRRRRRSSPAPCPGASHPRFRCHCSRRSCRRKKPSRVSPTAALRGADPIDSPHAVATPSTWIVPAVLLALAAVAGDRTARSTACRSSATPQRSPWSSARRCWCRSCSSPWSVDCVRPSAGCSSVEDWLAVDQPVGRRPAPVDLGGGPRRQPVDDGGHRHHDRQLPADGRLLDSADPAGRPLHQPRLTAATGHGRHAVA